MPGPDVGAEDKTDQAAVDSLVQVARDTSLAHGVRLDAAEAAVKLGRSVEAMHVLARLTMAGGDEASPQKAEHWMVRVLRREPDNADYRATYAELLWIWDRRGDSYTQAKKALAIDPDHTGALLVAARYLLWQMTMYIETEWASGNRDSRTGEYVSASLEEFGEADRDLAIGYLERLLDLRPDHRPARVMLGLVHFESGGADRLVELWQAYAEDHPSDRDAHFFVGLGHQDKDEHRAAYEAYGRGLAVMSEADRRFMQSLFVIQDAKAEKGDLPSEEDIRRFWTGRDPVFLTQANERLLEHCRRVAYANLRYGDPVKGIEGWRTDRGQAYIRYGHPVARTMRPAEIDVGLDDSVEEQVAREERDRIVRQPLSEFKPRVERWTYDGFEIVFQYGNLGDAWRYKTALVNGWPMAFSELVDRIPEHYRDPEWTKRFDLPYQVAQFRGEGGLTRVEVYYAVPAGEVASKASGPGLREVDLIQGLFLYDAEWDTLRREVGRVDRLPWVRSAGAGEGHLLASETMALQAGAYHIGAEVEDRGAGSIGILRDSLQVRRFGSDSLEMSSLLMARRIVEREDASTGRERFIILPNPPKRCRRDGSVSFYFEVYNLARDAFGTTNYRVTYQMRVIPAAGPEGGEPEWTTAVSSDFRGSQDWEPFRLALDLEGTPPGLREFRVVVEDQNTMQQATGETTFRVIW